MIYNLIIVNINALVLTLDIFKNEKKLYLKNKLMN